MGKFGNYRFIYFACPRCLKIYTFEYLPLNIICEHCFKKIKDEQPQKTLKKEWEEIIEKEITLQKLVPIRCSSEKDGNKCNGDKLFFRGISVCSKCYSNFFAPNLFIEHRKPFGQIWHFGKYGLQYFDQKNSINPQIFELQKQGKIFVFEQKHPFSDKNIYFVWETPRDSKQFFAK